MLNCEDLEFSLRACPWRHHKFRCLAMGIKVVVTQPCNNRSAPDFTRSIRIQAWTHLNTNIHYNQSATCWQQEMTCFTNLNMQCPICTKLHIFGKTPGLKTKGQSDIIIAPPADNRIHVYTNSNIPCSICTKLHMFDKSIGLKTSTCQCLVIDIAPPGGYRKLLVLHQLKHALSNLHQTSHIW